MDSQKRRTRRWLARPKVWRVIEFVAKALSYRGKLNNQELDYLLSVVESPDQQAPLDFLGGQANSGLIDLENLDKYEGQTRARSSAPEISWPINSTLPCSLTSLKMALPSTVLPLILRGSTDRVVAAR